MHKRFVLALVAVALLAAGINHRSIAAPSAPSSPRVNPRVPSAPAELAAPRLRVFFSPDGGCTEAIVEALGKAKTSIDLQAYSFTSAPIAQAVAKAFERGVKVRVVLDKSQRSEHYTSATYLANHNVPTWIDSKHAIAHNKIILIDGGTIFTGSFNFTKAAEQKNAENLLMIEGDSKLYAEYLSNFEEHLGHSDRYDGLGKRDAGGDQAAPKVEPAAPNKTAATRTRKAA